MSESGSVWRLVRSDEILADLVVTGGDFPWLNAQVQPAPGFEEVRPLFEEELGRLDRVDDDSGPWEAAYRRIRQAVCLVAPDGLCPNSCSISTATTRGGGGAMSPFPKQETRGNGFPTRAHAA